MGSRTSISSHALSAWFVFVMETSPKPLVEIKAHGANHSALKADAVRQIKACVDSKVKHHVLDPNAIYNNVKVCGTVPPGRTPFCLLVRFSGTILNIVEAAESQLEQLIKELPLVADNGDPQHLTLLQRAIDNADAAKEARSFLADRRVAREVGSHRRRVLRG